MNKVRRGGPDGSRRDSAGEGDDAAPLAGPSPGLDAENALFSERPHSDRPEADASAIMVRPDNVERPIYNERIGDLVQQIKELADKLQAEGASRGDVKILSRSIRELRYAFKVFGPYRNQRKVTVFGSARTKPEHPDYQLAVEFGRLMAEKDWLIVTGAANGIMEAGHVGAGREKSMGLNIMLPFEQGANSVIAGDRKLVNMKYFFTRKLMFVKECHAVVLFPGGFGTLDEGFEVLTLLQTGKRDMIPVVLCEPPGRSYWRDFDDYIRRRLLGERLISPEDLSLYRIVHSAQDAADEVLKFYRVYHSQRFVGNKLVFRLQSELSLDCLEAINDTFADLLAVGQFQQMEALAEERDAEPEIAHLPRLVFRYNRRNLGRQRQLIDFINNTGSC